MNMPSSVDIFDPLFENIHFSIFQQLRMLKILAAVKKNVKFSQPGPPWARFCDPGVPDHLETPQSGQMDPKMEIYVEIICCEHFRFYGENNFVMIFWTLCSENWPFLDNFDKNLFLVNSMKHMDNLQKLSRNKFSVEF